MVIFFTGHRPPRLGGFDPANEIAAWSRAALTRAVARALATGDVTRWITGGALYTDQWAAQAVLDQGDGARLTVARPFPSQQNMWPPEVQDAYMLLLESVWDAGGDVLDVSQDPFTAEKMMLRDHWMVDQATCGIAVWDGGAGGTGHTIAYARKKSLPFYHINPQTRRCAWEKPPSVTSG